MTPIGISLRSLRHQRRLTQAQLAAVSGVSQRKISLIETAQIDSVDRKSVHALGLALGLSGEALAALHADASVSRLVLEIPKNAPAQTVEALNRVFALALAHHSATEGETV